MQERNGVSFCIPLGVLFFVMVLCVPAAAVIVELTEGNLTDTRYEGDLVEYTIAVSGVPKQAQYIEMNTDVTPVPDVPLWQPERDGVTVTGGDEALNDHTITLETDETGAFTEPVMVTVTGRAPVLTTVTVTDGVVVTKRNTQTTGYVYYRIEARDENRDLIGSGTTRTFSVLVPDEEAFRARLDAVGDPELRYLIDDLYSRGLRDEAGDLLVYAETPEEPVVSVTTAVLLGVVLLIVGFAGGMVFGKIRAKNIQEFQREYGGNE
ncbi:hypothetical protein [Methanogenium organophilum]|uniref:Uncharacterized protein n=1 Tax=Methanogenium organophilum TaxID=2199 RepID=A0A9X9T9K0_METOG|nr:hypothetical protein [Methanogenium organophilum]WAI02486.1 hypothetical protein OU421_06320 [Methanogenium organophilum]